MNAWAAVSRSLSDGNVWRSAGVEEDHIIYVEVVDGAGFEESGSPSRPEVVRGFVRFTGS